MRETQARNSTTNSAIQDPRIGYYTGRIQIRVLTNCQEISTEIGTDSLKI